MTRATEKFLSQQTNQPTGRQAKNKISVFIRTRKSFSFLVRDNFLTIFFSQFEKLFLTRRERRKKSFSLFYFSVSDRQENLSPLLDKSFIAKKNDESSFSFFLFLFFCRTRENAFIVFAFLFRLDKRNFQNKNSEYFLVYCLRERKISDV